MNKTLIFLILATCTVIISVAIISIAPNINNVHGNSNNWATQNCELISDHIKLLKGDITTLKKMKNLCYRQKAMHNMEYATFIINIIIGFVCADLALIHYLGFGKDFEIRIIRNQKEMHNFVKAGQYTAIIGHGIYDEEGNLVIDTCYDQHLKYVDPTAVIEANIAA